MNGGSVRVRVTAQSSFGHFDDYVLAEFDLTILENPYRPFVERDYTRWTLGPEEDSVNLRDVFIISSGAYEFEDFIYTFIVDGVENPAGIITGIDPEALETVFTVRIVFTSVLFIDEENSAIQYYYFTPYYAEFTLTVFPYSSLIPFLMQDDYEVELPLRENALRLDDIILLNDGAHYNRYTYSFIIVEGAGATLEGSMLTVPFSGGEYVIDIRIVSRDNLFDPYLLRFTLTVTASAAERPSVENYQGDYQFELGEEELDVNDLFGIDNGAYSADDFTYTVFVNGAETSVIPAVSVDTTFDIKIVISSGFFGDIVFEDTLFVLYARSDDTSISGITVTVGGVTYNATRVVDNFYRIAVDTPETQFAIAALISSIQQFAVEGSVDNVVTMAVNNFNRTFTVTVTAENGDIRLYYLTIERPAVIDIEINVLGVKRVYELGEPISYENLIVERLTSDGGRTVLLGSEYTVLTDFDNTTPGTYTVVVVYGAFTKTYTVEVREAPTIRNIFLDTDGVKTVLAFDEDLDLSGLIVEALMSNFTFRTLTDAEYEVDLGGFRKDVAGNYIITVTAGGRNASFMVVVNERMGRRLH
jgi:hypothetical protein